LEVYLVVLDRVSRATTKKVVNFFLRKKCASPDKILATSLISSRLKQPRLRKCFAPMDNILNIRLIRPPDRYVGNP